MNIFKRIIMPIQIINEIQIPKNDNNDLMIISIDIVNINLEMMNIKLYFGDKYN